MKSTSEIRRMRIHLANPRFQDTRVAVRPEGKPGDGRGNSPIICWASSSGRSRYCRAPPRPPGELLQELRLPCPREGTPLVRAPRPISDGTELLLLLMPGALCRRRSRWPPQELLMPDRAGRILSQDRGVAHARAGPRCDSRRWPGRHPCCGPRAASSGWRKARTTLMHTGQCGSRTSRVRRADLPASDAGG